MSQVEDFILSNTESTFQYDKDLLTLPVPDLSFTLQKYLDSVRVLVSDEEYRQTEFLAQQFASGEGKYLQAKLKQKAKSERNWLDKWWEEAAYLEGRAPIIFSNMGGPGPYGEDVWPALANSQLERTSLLVHYTIKIWQFVHREQYKPLKSNKGMPLCMYQFKRVFNTCRVPGVFKDHLMQYFKTASEGECPSHVTVLCKGHIFLLNTLDEAGEVLTAPELQIQLTRIREQAEQQEQPSQGVNVLSSLPRDDWARARSTLLALHPQNFEILEKIQSSVVTVSLEDNDATDMNDLGYKALLGEMDNRWFDKSLGIVVYRNGLSLSTADHTPAEGMMMIYITGYVYAKIKEINGKWQGTKALRPLPPPQLMKFVLDDSITKQVQVAKAKYTEMTSLASSNIHVHQKYGKAFCKKLKFHPDTYCQLAMQLTYYTIYNRMAPTYETAAIKQFYHGRTETVRSCTMEAFNWCKAMLDPASSVEERGRLFTLAVNKHNTLMAEACDFKGCDRHLLGLYLVGREEGRPVNPLFTDPSFTKSGGGGNFILSTSCIGYTPIIGAVLPMCKDSIGIFYRILDDSFLFYITTWNADKDTDCNEFGDVLSQSLDKMHDLLTQATLQSTARL